MAEIKEHIDKKKRLMNFWLIRLVEFSLQK